MDTKGTGGQLKTLPRFLRICPALRRLAAAFFAVLLVLCCAGCAGSGSGVGASGVAGSGESGSGVADAGAAASGVADAGADGSGTTHSGTDGAGGFMPRITEHHYKLAGLDREYRLLFIQDLHLIAENDPQVNAKDLDLVTQRRTQVFATPYGDSAAYWEQLAPVLDRFEADLIVFAGDMIDYASEENLALLRDGFSQINTPFIYLRADHDTEPFYADEQLTPEATHGMHDLLADNGGMPVYDLGGLTVIGWNNSTSQMTQAQLDTLRTLAAGDGETAGADTPLIFVTHVPLASPADTALAEVSRHPLDGRVLLWGSDCYYVPDAVTAEGLSLLYDGTLPVSHVFSAHLHFAYDGPLTDHCRQHVLAPAFSDSVTLVIFSPRP